MRRLRISISRLMVVIVLAAISFAALSRPTRLWAAIFFGTTASILVGAAIRAISARDEGTNYWRGFCVAGWIGFLLHFGPFRSIPVHADRSGDTYTTELPSLYVLDFLHEFGEQFRLIHDPYGEWALRTNAPEDFPIPVVTRTAIQAHWLDTESAIGPYSNPGVFGAGRHPCFVQIGYSIICLLIAFAGGWYGRRIGRIRTSEAEPDRSGEK